MVNGSSTPYQEEPNHAMGYRTPLAGQKLGKSFAVRSRTG